MGETTKKSIRDFELDINSKIYPNSTSFRSVVELRLQFFGYTNDKYARDQWVLDFAINKVETYINNSCNTTSIPEGLVYHAVDRVCGEFLLVMQKSGMLQMSELDLSGILNSISMGDTSVSFDADSTDEDKFNRLLDYLLNSGEGDLICYRKMRW